MNRNDIMEKVANIFREIFDDETLEIKNETNSEDIEDWDSLEHINLIISMEKEFNLKFKFDEIAKLEDVGEMVDLIEWKSKN